MKRRILVKKNDNKIAEKILLNKVSLFWILFILTLGVQVFFAVGFATSGASLSAIEKIELEINKKNKELSELLVNASSVTKASTKAQELGFVKPELMYLSADEFVAKLP